jgi:phenylacetate-CoA ligase
VSRVLTAHVPALAGVARRPRLGRAHILEFQARRLRRLVAHAYAHVPYYRDLFERHGVRPADIRGLDDLRAIPITEKAAVQFLPVERVVARGVDAERLIVHRSSGASGAPIAVRRTWFEDRVLGALRWRAMHAVGLGLTDHLATVRIYTRSLPRDHQWPQRIVQAAGLYRVTRLAGTRPPAEVAADLARVRPDAIAGYAGIVWRVSRAVGAGDRVGLRPRLVVTGGDLLTPSMRRDIATAFGARVFEMYGAEECNLIAWECPATGRLHTCDDGAIVEVLRDGRPARPGEPGEVVLTNLHAFAMPFIRYRLADVVTRGDEPCACGAPFSTIEGVHGRIIDYLTLPGGQVVNPGALIVTLGHGPRPWLRQFQVVQERTDLVTVSLLAERPPTAFELTATEDAIRRIVGPGVDVRTRLVPEIPLDPSGKFRPIRSLVTASPHDLLRRDPFP